MEHWHVLGTPNLTNTTYGCLPWAQTNALGHNGGTKNDVQKFINVGGIQVLPVPAMQIFSKTF